MAAEAYNAEFAAALPGIALTPSGRNFLLVNLQRWQRISRLELRWLLRSQ